MKKIIFIISFLLLGCLIILFYAFNKNKINQDYEIIKFDDTIVDLVLNEATDDIKISKYYIKNIHFDERNLIFDLIGDKEDLQNKTIDVVLFNDYAKSPGNVFSFQVSDVDKKEIDNGFRINVSSNDSYNNPYRIKFEIK